MADDAPAEGAGPAEPAKVHKRSTLAPKIKRMMQRDEEVGKISAYTPLALGKAMELFLESLATKATAEAKKRKSKMLTAAHLKAAVNADSVFDFLKDAVAKAPDLPPAAEGGGSDDSSGEGGGKPKRVRKPRPRKPKAAAEGGEGGSDSEYAEGEQAAKKPRKRAPPKPKPAKPTVDIDDDVDAGVAALPQPAPPPPAAEEPPAFEVPASFAAAAVAPPAGAAAEDYDDDYDA